MAETKKKTSTAKKSSTTKKSSSSKTPSIEKTLKKETKKAIKKASKTTGGKVAIALGVVAVVALGICYFTVPVFDGKTGFEYTKEHMGEHEHQHAADPVSFNGTVYDDLQINFLELGDWHTGDSVYIKAGETDILIDAGSKYASAEAIGNFVDQHCTDKKLEYVIATHAHEDHIAGFSGGKGKNDKGIFYKYEIGTIIEFARTDSDSTVYNNYVEARDYAVSKGAKVYTALQAYNNPAMKTVTLAPDITMTTLYQKYYEEKASTENDYSVCTLITYKDLNFLFTGDLESGGEKSLVEKNSLPKCELYKAGHHGSKTSSSTTLMKAIEPKVVCCCCCAGSDEYTKTEENKFPTQEFVNRVAPYTANIYVTSISLDDEKKVFGSMNGTICFSSNGTEYSVSCSNNNTLLKDTDWFKSHRNWPQS